MTQEFPSQLAGHTFALYDELSKLATPNDDGELVFVGKLTKVYNSLGISSSMYSRIKRILMGTKSIEILQRGTGAQPSIILLHGAPDPEIFSRKDLTAPRTFATLLGTLENRVETLEGWRESMPFSISEVLLDYEIRIVQLERAISAATSDIVSPDSQMEITGVAKVEAEMGSSESNINNANEPAKG